MRKIPEEFKTEGITINLIKRDKKKAIYKATLSETRTFSHYEVHKIRILQPREIEFRGKKIQQPLREAISGNEGFGTYAWSFPNLKLAEEHYNKLCASKLKV